MHMHTGIAFLRPNSDPCVLHLAGLLSLSVTSALLLAPLFRNGVIPWKEKNYEPVKAFLGLRVKYQTYAAVLFASSYK